MYKGPPNNAFRISAAGTYQIDVDNACPYTSGNVGWLISDSNKQYPLPNTQDHTLRLYLPPGNYVISAASTGVCSGSLDGVSGGNPSFTVSGPE